MTPIEEIMYVVLVRYTRPEDEVMRHLKPHQRFIEQGYERGVFLVSGRGADGDRGVIVTAGIGREDLVDLMREDPFHQAGVAEHEIVGFHASRACDALALHRTQPGVAT